MNPALTVVLWLLALPAVLSCAYLLLLTLFSARLSTPAAVSRRLRFDLIVPAHNEAIVIERCIASLRVLDWPADRFRVWVVADHCDDDTATLARRAGAQVLDRRDSPLRGKAYALDLAFKRCLREGWSDALIIIDADTVVSDNLLSAFAARIENGASVMQARYGVLNAWTSWRTRLMTIAYGTVHDLRSQARERLRLSCGLRGNGWCVSCDLLRQIPCQAFSQTEDLEYGIDLGLAGVRVRYVGEARADAEMFTGEAESVGQRQRWESGRFRLLRQRAWPLLRRAIVHRDRICLDLAAELLVPPLSYIVLNVCALITLALVIAIWQPGATPWLWIGLACGSAVLLYVLRGWQLSGLGLRALPDLARVPFFMLWKLLVLLRRNPGTWREPNADHRRTP